MIDRELIDSFKAEMSWVESDQRFTVTNRPSAVPDARVTKHGTGICRICGAEFGKLTKKSEVCPATACKVARNSKYQMASRQKRGKA
jgi:hypothetical protein